MNLQNGSVLGKSGKVSSFPTFTSSFSAMSESSPRRPFQRGSSINTSIRESSTSKSNAESNVSWQSHTGESNGIKHQSPPASNLEDAKSRERIAAYKEERRRQLQTRKIDKNNGESFSSSSESSIRRSLRLKDKISQGTSSSISSTSNSTGVRRFITRDLSSTSSQPWKESTSTEASGTDTTVRSTRASRLRAQMNIHPKIGEDSVKEESLHRNSVETIQSHSRLPVSNQSSTDHNENVTERKAFGKLPTCQRVESIISSTTESDNSSEPGGAKLKDKSAKRKSNLNRASVLEEVIKPPTTSLERRTRKQQQKREGSQTSESDKNELVSAKVTDSNKRSSSDSQSDGKALSSLIVQKRPSVEKQLDSRLKSKGSFSKKPTALKRPEIPEILKRTSSPSNRSSPSRDPEKHPQIRESTPKRSSLTDTFAEIEQSRCDLNLSLNSSCCLSSDKHSDDSYHSVSQAPDTELEETFGTPPETLNRSVHLQEPSVIYTISVSTQGSSYPNEESQKPVEAVNLTPFTSFLGGIELSSPLKESAVLESYSPDFSHKSSNTEVIFTEAPKTPVPILKCKAMDEVRKDDIQGILKVRTKDESQEEQQRKPPSILKKRDSSEEKEFESTLLNPIFRQFIEETSGPAHSILKTKSLDDYTTQPKPILKRGSLSEEHNSENNLTRHLEAPRPILKKKTAEDEGILDEKPRPILKARLSHEDMTESMSSIFESDSGVLQSILRKPSADRGKISERRKEVRRNSDVTSDSSASLFRATNFGLRKNSGDLGAPAAVVPVSILKKPSDDLLVPSTKDSDICDDVSVQDTTITTSEKTKTSPIPAARRGGGLRVTDGVMPTARERFDRRNTPRYRTQPITQVEVQESDSLESVQAFRTLITTKASINVFEEEEAEVEEQQNETALKKEYPQHYRPERKKDRRTNNRYRTLPITLETPLEETSNCNASNVTTSSSSDEMSGLSVMAKASLFQQKALESCGLGRRSSEVKSRFLMRRSHPRSQTQPITEEEVHEAAKMVDGNKKEKDKEKETTEDEKSDENDPSKLSLMEKMKLFNQKIQEEKKPQVLIEKGPRRRRSAGHSRFQTQPITTEEVRKANRHSFGGLAASLRPAEQEEDENGDLEGTITSASSSSLWKSTVLKEAEKKQTSTDSNTSTAAMVAKMAAATAAAAGRNRTSSSPPAPGGESPEAVRPVTARGRLLTERRKTESDAPPPDGSTGDCPRATTVPPPTTDHKAGRDSTSSSSSSEDEGEETGEGDQKKVLTGGQSHLVFYSPGQTAPLDRGLRKPIANPGIQRKLNANLRRKEERRLQELQQLQQDSSEGKVLQQSSNLSAQESPSALRARESGDAPADIQPLIKRSQTQPMPPKSGLDSSPVVEGGSIKERLAALQRSGTEDWQKRLFQSPENTAKQAVSKSSPQVQTLDSEDDHSEETAPTALASRLSKLQRSSEQWRHRVEEKDAVQFTVAGKMAAASANSPGTLNGSRESSPSLERRAKRIPLPFRSPQTEKLQDNKKEPSFVLGLSKSKSVPVALGNLKNDRPSSEEDDTEKGHQVLVPKADDETFSSFYDLPQFFKSRSVVLNENLPQISTESLNQISSSSQLLSVQHKRVQVQKRHHTGSRNPIRALASRADFQKQEYLEVTSTGVAEKELQRIQIEKLAKTSNKSLSALAGLASAENFKNVALRKGGETGTALLPSHDLMLVQVKGRRHVQTRLVEPCVFSLNQGDSYVLVTPNKVFCWIGAYTNVIERAKVLEVASVVHLKKDLCFRGSTPPVIIDLDKKPEKTEKHDLSPTCTSKDIKEFYSLLGVEKLEENSIPGAGAPEEDEQYESSIIITNAMYILEGDSLVANKEHWGGLPKVEALKTDMVFVFDFGSEMYVWKGKHSLQEHRSLGTKLAKQLWEKGYDYSECHINPIHPKSIKKLDGESKAEKEENGKKSGSTRESSKTVVEDKNNFSSSIRPKWCIFASINQHMEPVLFREKFLDWPDTSRLIKVKGQDDEPDSTSKVIEELKPCDGKEMLNRPCPNPDLILETQNIGRGLEYHDTAERRFYEITSLEVNVWHILEYESRRLPYANGQLHAGDSYVVRWRYMVIQKGRSLGGTISRHSFTGRERCAYFFWQGQNSSITEKGASALMTVELDEERGPHVRVNQGKEPPCFLNLFEGRMIVYKGEREDETTNIPGPWKLFIVRGQSASEAFLLELEPVISSLRSRASFLLINCTTGLIHIWHGCHTNTKVQEVARQAAKNIVDVQPEEMVFESGAILKTVEIFHGSEPEIFKEALSTSTTNWLKSVPVNTADLEVSSPRLFHLSSVSGTFLADEILCSFRSSDNPCLLPFLQENLYSSPQPALFLLDPSRGDCLYLWQGWWPEGDEETCNVSTGSATMRWSTDRRCAMQTALDYAKAKNVDSPVKVYLVSAGLEPRAFTELFPEWHQDNYITQLNLQDGKQTVGECLDVSQVLAHLTRTHYTLEELQTLPEGVDPLNLERYLTETDFEDVMKMKKEEFYKLPKWKQTKLKKEAQLF